MRVAINHGAPGDGETFSYPPYISRAGIVLDTGVEA